MANFTKKTAKDSDVPEPLAVPPLVEEPQTNSDDVLKVRPQNKVAPVSNSLLGSAGKISSKVPVVDPETVVTVDDVADEGVEVPGVSEIFTELEEAEKQPIHEEVVEQFHEEVVEQFPEEVVVQSEPPALVQDQYGDIEISMQNYSAVPGYTVEYEEDVQQVPQRPVRHSNVAPRKPKRRLLKFVCFLLVLGVLGIASAFVYANFFGPSPKERAITLLQGHFESHDLVSLFSEINIPEIGEVFTADLSMSVPLDLMGLGLDALNLDDLKVNLTIGSTSNDLLIGGNVQIAGATLGLQIEDRGVFLMTESITGSNVFLPLEDLGADLLGTFDVSIPSFDFATGSSTDFSEILLDFLKTAITDDMVSVSGDKIVIEGTANDSQRILRLFIDDVLKNAEMVGLISPLVGSVDSYLSSLEEYYQGIVQGGLFTFTIEMEARSSVPIIKLSESLVSLNVELRSGLSRMEYSYGVREERNVVSSESVLTMFESNIEIMRLEFTSVSGEDSNYELKLRGSGVSLSIPITVSSVGDTTTVVMTLGGVSTGLGVDVSRAILTSSPGEFSLELISSIGDTMFRVRVRSTPSELTPVTNWIRADELSDAHFVSLMQNIPVLQTFMLNVPDDEFLDPVENLPWEGDIQWGEEDDVEDPEPEIPEIPEEPSVPNPLDILEGFIETVEIPELLEIPESYVETFTRLVSPETQDESLWVNVASRPVWYLGSDTVSNPLALGGSILYFDWGWLEDESPYMRGIYGGIPNIIGFLGQYLSFVVEEYGFASFPNNGFVDEYFGMFAVRTLRDGVLWTMFFQYDTVEGWISIELQIS